LYNILELIIQEFTQQVNVKVHQTGKFTFTYSAEIKERIDMDKVTAGRDQLGSFAPKFAELNDDVLFGEVWSREEQLSARDRSIVTVTILMASGILDSSFRFHIQNAKNHGVTKEEMAEILTHAAFYAGWTKAWAAFRIAKEVYER
jgi:4-carboxymuconolactone decarboxylase